MDKPVGETNKNKIISWIDRRRKLSNLKVQIIPINEIKNWKFNGISITHEKNSYFSIIGVEVIAEEKNDSSWEQPIILQQEIGEMSFLIHGTKILIHAKTEPGNVNGTQIAPTIQATISNYKRVHGGDETKFLKYCMEPGDNHQKLSDSVQLEQGTRFMNKSNRNSIIRLQTGHLLEDVDDRFKWVETQELFSLLETDYLINTDARSVLVSCNWEVLTKNQIAFSPSTKSFEFKNILNKSYYQKVDDSIIATRLKEIQNKKKFSFRIKDLTEVKNWKVNDEVIIDDEQIEFAVRGFRVSTSDREVSNWEQPLVHNLSLGQVILYCQNQNGVLKFLLNAEIIIGGDETMVWGPSIQNTIVDTSIGFEGQTIHAECMQSDEGGRFYESRCLYQIIEISETEKNILNPETSYWASLAEIQNLLIQSKKTTNELRSTLALLLKFL
jgi:oxidase EvaA